MDSGKVPEGAHRTEWLRKGAKGAGRHREAQD